LLAVDLFAGAGGLSEGFIRAGFDVVAYIEADSNACETLRTRHQYWQLRREGLLQEYWKYLNSEVTKDEFRKIMKESDPVIGVYLSSETISSVITEIKRLLHKKGKTSLDLFIGGPPCQAYSIVGRSRNREKMSNDPRKLLYKHYIELLKVFRPSIFVFENVPGLLTVDSGCFYKKMLDDFRSVGYTIDSEPHVLDSFDFGVLQHRKRIMMIGWQKSMSLSYPVFENRLCEYRVLEVFSDLPHLKPGYSSADDYLSNPSSYLVDMRIREPEDRLTQHDTRALREIDREIYRYVIAVWNKEKRRVRYSELPEHLRTHKNLKSFEDRFKVVASDLNYAQSLVAHLAKDGHYFIHPSLEQARSISVREAARLQSFPDSYFFEGGGLQRYKQIGNAVPPLMAEKIAEKIKEMLKAQ